MKIGLFYGTTTGNTEEAADLILDELEDLALEKQDVSSLRATDLLGYDVLIIGCPTWNVGELQSDWEAIYEEMDDITFEGSPRFALFGCGDAFGYADNFQDSLGILHEKLEERGAKGGIGYWPTAGYEHNESEAILDSHPDHFCGLALDNDNEPELTEERIKTWCAQLRKEIEAVVAG